MAKKEKIVGKTVVVTWDNKFSRECYGMPTGVIKSYDPQTHLYKVEHIEKSGLAHHAYYSEDEFSRSLLLRLVSKAQQNKIETMLSLIHKINTLKNNHYKLYCMMWMCVSTLSMYYLFS